MIGFQHKSNANACRKALRQRFAKFQLTLHEEKTRLIEFGRFAANAGGRGGTSTRFRFPRLHPLLLDGSPRFSLRREASQQPETDVTSAAVDQGTASMAATPTARRNRSLNGAGVQDRLNYLAVPGKTTFSGDS